MKIRQKLPLVGIITISLVAGCKTPPEPPRPKLTKFQCLSAPSAAYQAGAVIRSIAGSVAAQNNISADQLTLAWTPIDKPTFSGSFSDIDQEIKPNVSASLVGKIFENLGVKADLSAEATYSITVKAHENSQYIADDSVRFNTFESIKRKKGIIASARYFFVKEAIGSQDLTYQASNKVSVAVKAQLLADSSGLAADITPINAGTTLASKKELIACVVLEEMGVTVISAADGKTDFSISPTGRQVVPSDLAAIEGAKVAK